MPEQLPSVRPADVVRALTKAGFVQTRQRGSHVFLVHPEKRLATTVAMHRREMKRPMLQAIIRQAGLTVDEFVQLLKS